MDASERSEFERHLTVLCAAFDVPCTEERKEAYWLSLSRMSLLTFARTVERILTEEDWTRIPKPPQVWGSSKRLRAAAPEQPVDDGFRGDVWDMAANRHLLAHIVKTVAAKRAITPQETVRLVAAKNSWAADMRDLDGGRKNVAVDLQRKIWNDYVTRAEAA